MIILSYAFLVWCNKCVHFNKQSLNHHLQHKIENVKKKKYSLFYNFSTTNIININFVRLSVKPFDQFSKMLSSCNAHCICITRIKQFKRKNNTYIFDFLFVLIINLREDVVMGSGGGDLGCLHPIPTGVAVEILTGVHGTIHLTENVSTGLYTFWTVTYL